MISSTGSCPKCMAVNSRSAVKCIECGERLPWADEAERQIASNAQAAKQAQQAVQVQKVAQAAKTSAAKTPTLDDDDMEWWMIIGLGILIIGIAAFGFWRFSVMETTGGMMRTRWYIALLYSLGGKWLVGGLFGAIGIGTIIVGVMKYFEERK